MTDGINRGVGKTVAEVEAVLGKHRPGIMGEQNFSRFSVLIPLVKGEDGQLSVLFEKRAATMRRQAGEICFPGGRIDPEDASEWDAARRETSEELGLPLERIRYAGTLDTLVTPAACIYPFVGLLDSLEELHPNPAEVGEVFLVPLATLLATSPDIYLAKMRVEPGPDYPYHLIPGGEGYPWRFGSVSHYFYQLEGRIVWGMTARILTHFIDLLRGENE
ncbi:CoA pyrophosphatase [Brevibacillus ruminantium]|uniref:CoA pyrophosphatase n=1 Tax=Brevibacillus ruminantium TaxID=2950604 RepID=A0ABY4WIQ2_9BACL|nr:CoA pyrophosphatase [Brevibacillus ruminantium]USG66982.1 CoA pyrophosphatase [Brevibacillus ruminantium]